MTGSGMEDIIKLIKSFDCMGWMTGRWRKGICLLSALMPSIFVMMNGIAYFFVHDFTHKKEAFPCRNVS